MKIPTTEIALPLRRGTFLGSAWGPFQDVKRVWAEYFEGKPYKSHAFGIAGTRPFPEPARLPYSNLCCIPDMYSQTLLPVSLPRRDAFYRAG